MNYRAIIKWCSTALLAIVTAACTTDFEEINEDPNNPVDVPAMTILTYAISAGMSREGGSMAMHGVGLWAQHYAKVQYLDEDRYAYRPTEIDAHWDNSYSNELEDLKIVIEKAKEEGFPNLEAMGRIMKARFFLRNTDLWGDISYWTDSGDPDLASEALTGDEEGGTVTPQYDSQEHIYTDLLNDLEKAAGLIDAFAADADLVAGGGDLVYGGDVEKWEKLANALRLRIYIHMSGVDAATAQAGIQGIISAGDPIFESNADDAQLDYLTDKRHWNSLYSWNFGRTDFSTSKSLIDLLLQLDDPRLPIYAQDIDADVLHGTDGSDTTYVGQINGDCGSGPQISTVSLIGKQPGYSPDQPFYIMTYAEQNFILAEAAHNGWSVGGTAQDFYEAGILASMDKWSADAGDYLTHDHVVLSSDPDSARHQIGIQKWLALYTQSVEGFTEIRRTGFPKLVEKDELPCTVYPGRRIPLRFPYPLVESVTNGSNYDKAVVGVVDDVYGERLWWDTRTHWWTDPPIARQ